MKNRVLFPLWGGLYLLCVLLGFVNQLSPALIVLRDLLGLAFFIPGAVLLHRGVWGKETKSRKAVRLISGISLGLTLILLVLNFLSVLAPEGVGNLLHAILVVVSAPMFCLRYWVASLFLWGCLFCGSFLKVKT